MNVLLEGKVYSEVYGENLIIYIRGEGGEWYMSLCVLVYIREEREANGIHLYMC